MTTGIHSFAAVDDEGATLILVEVLGEASSAIWLARAEGPPATSGG